MSPLGNVLNPYILTEAQLLAIYNQAIANITAGKVLMSFNGEGTQASSQFSAPPMEIAILANKALRQKNPKKYGYLSTNSRVFFA